ncbi:MAG: type 4a pilus biogenesis protein PilO [Candidatus Edwardsbacteria bacterium]
MDIKDPKTQIMIVLIVLALAVAFLFYKFSYSPTKVEINQLIQQEKSTREELETVRAVVATLPQMKEQYELLVKRWEKAQEYLPTEKEISKLLKSMTHAGIESGVKLTLFKYSTGPGAELYYSIPVTISLASNYLQLGTFLTALGNLPRIVTTSDLKVAPYTDPKDKIKTIKADFTATTYVFKMGGEKIEKKKTP